MENRVLEHFLDANQALVGLVTPRLLRLEDFTHDLKSGCTSCPVCSVEAQQGMEGTF